MSSQRADHYIHNMRQHCVRDGPPAGPALLGARRPAQTKSRSKSKSMATHQEQRRQLDLIFLFDAVVSVLFGAAALLTPHGLLKFIVGGT